MADRVARVLAASVVCLPLILLPPQSGAATLAECSPSERNAALARDETDVLAAVGSQTTLRGPLDLTLLGMKGWPALGHGFTSFNGMGMAVVSPAEIVAPDVRPGAPAVLLYRPNPTATNVTDTAWPDYPYTLVGWAYTSTYDYLRHPRGLPCAERADWFVHERGIHEAHSGLFVPAAPHEEFHGADPGDMVFLPPAIGAPHGRFWVLHVWRSTTGVPTLGITHPEMTIPGADSGVGVAFFFPE